MCNWMAEYILTLDLQGLKKGSLCNIVCFENFFSLLRMKMHLNILGRPPREL